MLLSGGEALLKIVDLNKDDLKFNSSTDFTCIDDINYAKFINDDYILLIDIKNTIKIFNFNNKKLIMKLVATLEDEEHILDNVDFLINKEDKNFNIKLIYGDNGGNL